MGSTADPHEISQGALFLASDEPNFTTGAKLTIGGYAAR